MFMEITISEIRIRLNLSCFREIKKNENNGKNRQHLLYYNGHCYGEMKFMEKEVIECFVQIVERIIIQMHHIAFLVVCG